MLSLTLIVGLFAGAAAGAIAMAFLAAAQYRRGYEDAVRRRDLWRLDLVARRTTSDRVRHAA